MFIVARFFLRICANDREFHCEMCARKGNVIASIVGLLRVHVDIEGGYRCTERDEATVYFRLNSERRMSWRLMSFVEVNRRLLIDVAVYRCMKEITCNRSWCKAVMENTPCSLATSCAIPFINRRPSAQICS